MRIVNVISCCVPGGAEILVRDTLKFLAQDKKNIIELWVISKVKDSNLEATESKIKFEKKYIEELEKEGIVIKYVGKRAGKDLIKTWLTLRKFFKEFKPNILHSHLEKVTFHTIIGTLGLNSKKIQTIHNTKINYSNIQKYFLNYFLDYFISISPEVTKEISKIRIPTKKIVEILNGVKVDKFKQNTKVNNNFTRFIAIGRIVKQKNYPLMLKSFAKFIKSLPEEEKRKQKLSIVGEGEEDYLIKGIIKKLDLENNVELLGVRENISELLLDSDVYMMSSKWEGFSISLIEAAAAGLPIIATNVGSNSLIVKDGENGYLVDSESEENFFKAIKNLDKYKIEKYSKKSREIASKYDLKISVQKLINLYKK